MFIDAIVVSPHQNLPIWQLQILEPAYMTQIFKLFIFKSHTLNAHGYIIRTQRYILTCRIGLSVQWPSCPEQYRQNNTQIHRYKPQIHDDGQFKKLLT
jgi:hypothetical protein